MAIRPQTTSTGPRGHSDSTTQTLWATGSSYPHSQRCVGQMYLRSEHILISGPKVLQRLPKGHRNCKHLFRGTYSIWWVTILSKPTENHQWNVFPRIREVAKDDLVGLHLRLWRSLWTLPWRQFCVSCWNSLLVLRKTLQKVLIWECEEQLHMCIFSNCKCLTFFLLIWWSPWTLFHSRDQL